MRLGLLMFPTDRSMRPDDLARAAEERGFESLFFPEHTHIPVSRDTPYPGQGELPEEYRRTLDPFVALTAAAAATTRLLLGTGICLVAQHDPIALAKSIATLDWLSGGRVLFGIGYGWNKEELAHHGVDYGQRREVVRERVLAMRELWTQEEAAFEGEHVHLSPSWAWPKPAQDPHPPVLIGGGPGPSTFEHVVEFGDAWLPLARTDVEGGMKQLREVAEQAGRDPDSIGVTVYRAPAQPEELGRFADLGVERALLQLPSAPEDEVMEVLERRAELLDEFGRS